jgi:hypothetical protein
MLKGVRRKRRIYVKKDGLETETEEEIYIEIDKRDGYREIAKNMRKLKRDIDFKN